MTILSLKTMMNMKSIHEIFLIKCTTVKPLPMALAPITFFNPLEE